ncbi:MAG: integration host factor subunit alpha [Magnetococcales bacterium]|nr:integration host factor subunit alpha [Magnetococcales bacterium]
MTKVEIVEIVRSKIGVSTKDAAVLVESLFEMIRVSLEKGEDVKLPGFGNFRIRNKRERIGRNPKTGATMPITARKIVTFKPSQILKDRVNKSK